jgi:hypothetical protein
MHLRLGICADGYEEGTVTLLGHHHLAGWMGFFRSLTNGIWSCNSFFELFILRYAVTRKCHQRSALVLLKRQQIVRNGPH